MKKLLLIPLLFLITPYTKADMDYVCTTDYDNWGYFIEEKCERNNILFLRKVPKALIDVWSARWCRFDREINFFEREDNPNLMNLTCVLYDKKPRNLRIQTKD